jgi:hypothetical protein
MSSLQLDSSSQLVPEPQKLPQGLVEKCAAISVRPDAIKDLISAMNCKLQFAVLDLSVCMSTIGILGMLRLKLAVNVFELFV